MSKKPCRKKYEIEVRFRLRVTVVVVLKRPPYNRFSLYETVRSTLLNHPQGEAVVLAAEGSFSEESRREMIRILVSELVKLHGSCYPPEKAKVALAKAIITEFPHLKDERAKKGCERYYNAVTKKGFIEYRLWTLRTNLSPSKKKYRTRSRDSSVIKTKSINHNFSKLLSKEELQSKIAWMKYKPPNDSNRKDIEKYLLETLPKRREWILQESPTISQIFKEYPRLLDYNGDMIDKEFETLFEDKGDNFITKFSSYYCPRILTYAKLNDHTVYKGSTNITDKNLRGLIVLAGLLPTNNSVMQKKSGRKSKGKGKGI